MVIQIVWSTPNKVICYENTSSHTVTISYCMQLRYTQKLRLPDRSTKGASILRRLDASSEHLLPLVMRKQWQEVIGINSLWVDPGVEIGFRDWQLRNAVRDNFDTISVVSLDPGKQFKETKHACSTCVTRFSNALCSRQKYCNVY